MQAYPTHEHVLTTYTYMKNNPNEVMVTEAVRNPILDYYEDSYYWQKSELEARGQE